MFMTGVLCTVCGAQVYLEIQWRTARFVTNNYRDRTPGCMTTLVQDLNWDTLQQRQLIALDTALKVALAVSFISIICEYFCFITYQTSQNFQSWSNS